MVEPLEGLPIEVAVQKMLRTLGYDIQNDPHFRTTPQRVYGWLSEYASHGDESPAGLLDVVFPAETPDDLVIVGPVEYRSICAHHLLPVIGEAWVGYLPDRGICGLSKLARLVEYYAMQLTVQERVTKQVADFVDDQLKPQGCMVVIRAAHLCMQFRGVRANHAFTATSAVRGVHKDSPAARAEFLALMGDPR